MAEKDPASDYILVSSNKKAFHLYHISDKVEAGIVLQGTEVKSLRAKRCEMKDAHCRVDKSGNMELLNFHINPYEFGNRYNAIPDRPRRLLLKVKQIDKYSRGLQEKGTALIPLRVYFTHGLAKVELGLGKGKNYADKREDLKKRAEGRDAQRALRERNKGS